MAVLDFAAYTLSKINRPSQFLCAIRKNNVASDFILDTSNPEEVYLTYIQNSSSCCSEFATPGTEKTFYSNILTKDETTGQTGDPLYVAVTDYRAT